MRLYDDCKRMEYEAGGRRLVFGMERVHGVQGFTPRADPDLYTRIENEFKVTDQEEETYVEIFYKKASHRTQVYRTELNVSSEKPYFRVRTLSYTSKYVLCDNVYNTHLKLCATKINEPDTNSKEKCAKLNEVANSSLINVPFPHETGFLLWKQAKRFVINSVAVILTRVYDMTPSVIYRDSRDNTFSEKARPPVFPMFPLRDVAPSYYEISIETRGPSSPESFFRACVSVLLHGHDIEEMPSLNAWLHDPGIRAERDVRLSREMAQQRRREAVRDQQRFQEQSARRRLLQQLSRRPRGRRRRLLDNVTLRM